MKLTETQRSLVTMSLRYAAEHYRENASAMDEELQARSTANGYGPVCAKHFNLPWDI